MTINVFIKNSPILSPFFKKLERKIMKASNIKGLLFIGIDFKTGKIILYKGYHFDDIHRLGIISSKEHCYDLKLFLETIDVKEADESMLPDNFLEMPYTFFILNSEKQEKFKF